MLENISLSNFTRDSSFYGALTMGCTIKSFTLDQIRKRYIASQNNKGGRSGSVERRAIAIGGVGQLKVAEGNLEHEVITKLKEPRGIDFKGGMAAVSSENEVFIFSADGSVQSIKNPWFSYIHTVNFNASGSKILISSSGFDCLFEYDLNNLKEPIWSWFAWDHGLNEATDPSTGEPFILSRKEITHELPVKVISDPQNQSLPTAMRAAFINSAEYGAHGEVLITLFHRGEVRCVDQATGKADQVLFSGLTKPHGGKKSGSIAYATNTAGGEVQIKGEKEQVFAFEGLDGKHPGLEKLEWLQNSICFTDQQVWVTIDSNRTSLVIFSPTKELYDIVAYPDHWALQDINPGEFNSQVKKNLSSISNE